MKVRTYDRDRRSKADGVAAGGDPLHYLQIDALRTHAVAAVLAEKKCGRELDWQSLTLTCARFASSQLRMLGGCCIQPGHQIAVVPLYQDIDVSGSRHCS